MSGYRFITFTFAFSLLLSSISCASPCLISLELDGDDATGYGFYPLSPVASCEDLPRTKFINFKELPPAINYPIPVSMDSNTTSTTRSRRNTIESSPVDDLESATYQEMALTSKTSLVPLILIRRYCCFCFTDTCLSFFTFLFYFCACIIYGLCARLNCCGSFTLTETVDVRHKNNKINL